MEQVAGKHNPEEVFTYEDLRMLTNNFSRENFVGMTQLGMVFRGKIPEGWKGMKAQDVTVKVWKSITLFRKRVRYREDPFELRMRVVDEINFLREPVMERHPNLAKVKGYCFDGNNFGVVFDLNPFNTIRNLAAKGCFTWFHRMKIALALARLLQFLHGHHPRYLLRNLSAAHIMLDQDYNPILIDCAMIVGGSFGDRRRAGNGCHLGSHGYIDLDHLTTIGEWTEKRVVFAFGVILLELVVKCRVDCLPDFKYDGLSFLHEVAFYLYHYEKSKFCFGKFKYSLVNKEFEVEPDFSASDGRKLTKLGHRVC